MSKRIGRDKRLAKRVAEQIDARLKLGRFYVDEKSVFGQYAEKYMLVTLPATCKTATVIVTCQNSYFIIKGFISFTFSGGLSSLG